MADGETIKEFLVGIRYVPNEASQAKFRQGLTQAATATTALQQTVDAAAKALTQLGTQLKGVAEDPARKYEQATRKISAGHTEFLKNLKETGVKAIEVATVFAAGILRVAQNYEQLYYVAQRTNSTVAGLQAMSEAWRNVGLSGDAATQAFVSFHDALRDMPGLRVVLGSLVSPDDIKRIKDQFGGILSDEQALFEGAIQAIGKMFKSTDPMVRALATQYSEMFHLTADQVEQLSRNSEQRAEASVKYVERLKRLYGGDLQEAQKRHEDNVKAGVKLQQEWNNLLNDFAGIWDQTFGVAVKPLTEIIKLLDKALIWAQNFGREHPWFAWVEGLVAATGAVGAFSVVIGLLTARTRAVRALTVALAEAAAALKAVETAGAAGAAAPAATAAVAGAGAAGTAGALGAVGATIFAIYEMLKEGTGRPGSWTDPKSPNRFLDPSMPFGEKGGVPGWSAPAEEPAAAPMPSHQLGAIIGHTGPALLHAGEMVLPEPISRGLQAMIRASQQAGSAVRETGSRAAEYLSEWLTGAGGAIPRIVIENVEDFVEQLKRALKGEKEGGEEGDKDKAGGGEQKQPAGLPDKDELARGDWLPLGALRERFMELSKGLKLTHEKMLELWNQVWAEFAQAHPEKFMGGPGSAAEGAARGEGTGGGRGGGGGGALPGGGMDKPGEFAGTGKGHGSDLAKQAIQYFTSQGWTHEQAAGIAANIERESSWNPQDIGDSGKAVGLGQWHPDRQAKFKEVFGKDIRQASFGEQLQFMQWELTHTEARAGAQLKGAKTAGEAAAAVSRHYERPKDEEGEAAARGRTAERLMQLPQLPPPPSMASPGAPGAPGAYGVPGAVMNLGGTGALGKPGENLTKITVPGTNKSVTVNKAAAEAFQGFLGDLAKTGYKLTDVQGFANRDIRGGTGKSEHAFGAAIDINPEANPQGGTATDLPKNIHDMAAKWGLISGGDWKGKTYDPMHFQWGGSKPWEMAKALSQPLPVPPAQAAALQQPLPATMRPPDFDPITGAPRSAAGSGSDRFDPITGAPLTSETTNNGHTYNNTEGDRNINMSPTTNITINGEGGGQETASRYSRASSRIYGDLIRNLKTAVA
jgi:hypothetical protein